MLRGRLPFIAKIVALLLFFTIAGVLGTQILRRLNPNKIARITKPNLQGSLNAVFNNFKYVHHEGGRTRYTLTAARDKVFGDAHHELEEVRLEIYDSAEQPNGRIVSQRCRYDQVDGRLEFAGNVQVATADRLQLRTELLQYDQKKQQVDSPEKVQFQRDQIHGTCRGLLVDSPAERLEMRAAVNVKIEPTGVKLPDLVEPAVLQPGNDFPTNNAAKPTNDAATASVVPSTTITTNHKSKETKPSDNKSDNKKNPKESDQKNPKAGNDPSNTSAPHPRRTPEEKAARRRQREAARANKTSTAVTDTVATKSSVATESSATPDAPRPNPLMASNSPAPIVITGNWAEYTGKDRIIKLRGAAKITEATRTLNAQNLTAYLSPENQLNKVEARQNSALTSANPTQELRLVAQDMDFFFDNGTLASANARIDSLLTNKQPDNTLQVKSATMDFLFDDQGELSRAEAEGQAVAETLVGPGRRLTADRLVVITQPSPTGPVVERIRAKGNVYLKLDAAPATTAQPNPTEKELWAATADLFYYPDGQFLREAQAEQQVIMIETPVNAVAPAEKRTLNADKGKVLFYETNNLMQEFIAQGEVKVTIQPYPRAGEEPSPPKVSQSAQANLNFDRAGELLTARQEGNFRYQEGLRHALAERANYDSAKKFLTLREGKVMVWDDKARTQADEIDLYLISEESRARGHVRSTYYNPSTAGGATPFRNVKSPVFITANEAQSFYKRGEGIYTGEARAWQDDNFVKADRLELYRDDQRMVATGQVASALYQKKASETNTVPIFATADQMVYSDKNRRVEYQGTVKMRQAEESLDAAQVKIWLNDTDNQVKKLEAYQQVVLVQPGRRGEGEQAVYTAEDQRTVLLGNLAKVVSQAQGIVTGRRLTLLSGDDRILADDQQNSKRTRSVHTIQR